MKSFLLLISVVMAVNLHGRVIGNSENIYWVSPDGNATWEEARSSVPLDGADACNLTVANANASAGDLIYLRGGVYDNVGFINPANSGTENARIIFSNYNDEIVTITNANHGVRIDGQSYITVNGLNFYNMGHFLYIMNNADHNIISYCTFDKASNPNRWGGSKVYRSSRYNHVHNCIFSRWGYARDDGHSGALFDVGNEFDEADSSFYNLIEDNWLFYGGHHVLAGWSNYSVFRNNYMHHERPPDEDFGYRCVITHGKVTGRNLYEGNRIAFAHRASGMSLRSINNIIRFNAFYNNGLGGIQCVSMANYTPAHYNHIYHNVFFNNGHQATYRGFSGGVYFCDWGQGDPTGNVVKNNIFHNNAGGAITTDAVSDPQIVENNWDEEGDPGFVYRGDGSDLEPFGEKPDFRLLEESPCIDAGGFLTTITSRNGYGREFEVENAGYFMDGWNIIEGDEIQLEGQTVRARIIKVNYEENIITVDSPLSWVEGQGVALAYEGEAPDLGAHEYKRSTGIVRENETVHGFILEQNYPNPFNPSTRISFQLAENGHASLIIYDILGREIITLFNENRPAGKQTVEWNGTNYTGRPVGSGVYLYRLETDYGLSNVKRMVLLR